MTCRLFALVLFFLTSITQADTLDYKLSPEKVAKDTYVFIGAKEDFSYENGGNIVNTGFVVTEKGVVVIDTGPSYLYGQQMRQAIEKITDKPILKVFITHHHPDHFLGNQAYQDVPIYAMTETVKLLKRDAEGLLDNMYRMAGPWMSGTEAMVENVKPLLQAEETIGKHKFKYIQLNGHTESDLAILNETNGVLFAGDLVFNNRTLTTPHATPEDWFKSLNTLAGLDYSVLVPGHGEVTNDQTPIEQTRAYLAWLEETIKDAVEQGLDMTEVLVLPIPEQFKHFGVLHREYARSVTHRYPIYEKLIFN